MFFKKCLETFEGASHQKIISLFYLFSINPMKITRQEIPVREIYAGYLNNEEEGVLGYGGKLNIRPPYQREFVYKEKQRDEVIRTIQKGFPLNIMYRSRNADGSYELLDGQQRTLSICQYLEGDFSLDEKYFHSLPADQQEKILNYLLTIYICEGEPSEKLERFQIVNIAGEELTNQELLNAQHVGPRLTDAKRHFSKNNCPAYLLAKDYLNGSPIRQEYLEKALDWCSGGYIQSYMSAHQFDEDASELWQYFLSVINRVKMLFPNYRKEMKGLDRGNRYQLYKEQNYNAQKLEEQVKKLMEDEEVENKKGIYHYLLS